MTKVSVIVTTKNNAETIEACLISIKNQTCSDIELILVDNSSTDNTVDIAKKFTDNVYTKGPERSAQRNFAAQQSTGEYLLIIDSDMELSPTIVADCVSTISESVKAIIIPEESFGIGFWAQCKALERSFYNGVDWIEAPRFFNKELFIAVGGYDETIVGGEDWDLHIRLKTKTTIGRIQSFIRHNEGELYLREIIKSRAYYAKGFTKYFDKPNVKSNSKSGIGQALSVYSLLLSKPKTLFKKPIIGLGTLFMKTVEFGTIYIYMRRK